MPTGEPDTVIPALREWLRSERRLGVPHWPLSPCPGTETGRAQAATAAPGWERARSKSATSPEPEHFDAQRGDSASRDRPRAAPQVAGSLFPDDPDLPPLCTAELSSADAGEALAQLDTGFVKGCRKCPLHEQRTQTVFGLGNPRAELVFVGEGPGADEDAQGVPFVGRAGQLLTRMIAAMTLTREQVYICNIVKCRPPGNRTPNEDEAETCAPYLLRQLAILRPRVIVALGRPATQTLLVTKAPISKLRGQFHDFPPPALAHVPLPRTSLMPTFHPAYLLRNPPAKGDAWNDLQQVMRLLGIPIPQRG